MHNPQRAVGAVSRRYDMMRTGLRKERNERGAGSAV